MDIDYTPKKLAKTFADEKSILKAYGDRAKKIMQRHGELQVATSLDVMSKIPAARLHPLKGNKSGYWAVDIYKNWRICFEINQKPLPTLPDGGVDFTYGYCNYKRGGLPLKKQEHEYFRSKESIA